MDRRKALKIFGALFVCLAGHPLAKAAENTGLTDKSIQFQDFSKPTDYTFTEEGMGNIIIECKDGSKIVVPFSEIVDALRKP